MVQSRLKLGNTLLQALVLGQHSSGFCRHLLVAPLQQLVFGSYLRILHRHPFVARLQQLNFSRLPFATGC
jgi:hypothetical protein